MPAVVNAVDQIGDLPESIVKKRKELIDLGRNYGLLHEKTIKCSQDLDELINLHMKSHSGPTNMFLDNEAGLPNIKYSYEHDKVSDFKYEEKTVTLARSNIRFFLTQLITHLRLTIIGTRTVLALMDNGTTIGFAGLQVYRNSNDEKQSIVYKTAPLLRMNE